MDVEIRDVETEKEWDWYVSRHPGATFLQSWSWGNFHQSMGERVHRLGLYEGGRLVGVSLLTSHRVRAPPRLGPYLACPGGPLLDGNRHDLLVSWVHHVHDLARREGAWFIRVRPPEVDTCEARFRFRRLGFRDAPYHMHAENTLELDLTQPEQFLLAQMRPSTRYRIRRAEREGVIVRESEDVRDVEVLYNLQLETALRQSFVPYTLEHLTKQFESFRENDQVRLFIALRGGLPVASAMIMLYGPVAAYLHGASATSYLKLAASYLIQWDAIRDAKRRGFQTYNFWGVAPENRSNHPWQGLTTFKTGFGGRRVNYVHAQDLPTSKLYPLAHMFETLRRRRRGL